MKLLYKNGGDILAKTKEGLNIIWIFSTFSKLHWISLVINVWS